MLSGNRARTRLFVRTRPPFSQAFCMAQATRSSSSLVAHSDDPIENVSSWFQANLKPISYGLGAVIVTAGAIFLYRTTNMNAREKASAALYQAQAPLSEGKLPEAQAALEKVVTRYASTASGQQAAMLLAQVLFDQKQYDAGIKVLESASGSAGADFSASLQGLIGAGYDAKGEYIKAAEHFEKASGMAKFELDKGQFRASEARSLMSGKKLEEAKKIWEDLATREGLPFAQEAKVRLGEIAGTVK